MTAPVIRKGTVGEAELVAKLLHDFNTEFDAPVPENLELRFAQLIARDDVVVVLAGKVGFAYLTLRPSPYYDGPVAMLEELYVAPAHRGRAPVLRAARLHQHRGRITDVAVYPGAVKHNSDQ